MTYVCSTPRCPELVERTGLCGSCRGKLPRHKRPSGTYDARWRRRRAEYLRTHKTCECDRCRILPIAARPAATDVHHVRGTVSGERESDEDLRAYAHGHHSRETARLQPGGWNSLAARDRVRAGRTVDRHNPTASERRSG